MYLPKTSNSIFTILFFFKYTKFVSLSVWGIIEIWKPPFIKFAIVKEIPSTVIDPFSIIYFLYFFGKSKLINQDFPKKVIFLT